MSLTIKAFLHEQSWRSEPKEIRRFTIDQDVSTSFTYLLEKIAQVFPSVQAGNIVVGWMDNDGDLIVISSDEELVQALDQFDGSVFRLYLKKRSDVTFQGEAFTSPPFEAKPPAESGAGESGEQQQQKPAEADPSSQQSQQQQGQGGGAFHPGVVCDGCSGPIRGTRYKCLVCHDYDLCSGCEAKGLHVDHNMVTITDPFSYNPWGFQNPWARGFGGSGHPCHGGWWGQQHPGPHGFHGHQGFGHPGFGHPCGGAPWRFGGGHPPSFRGGHPGRRWGGGACGGGAPWWRRAAEKEAAGKTSGTSEPMETGGTAADAQQQQQPQPCGPQSEEERKTFLQGVGQAVSSFLEPFGVKVDMSVVGGEEKTPSAPTTSGEGASAETQEVPSEVIDQTLAQLKSMGYQDEGGWLTELVKAKGGDISKVLDALHPTDATISETD